MNRFEELCINNDGEYMEEEYGFTKSAQCVLVNTLYEDDVVKELEKIDSSLQDNREIKREMQEDNLSELIFDGEDYGIVLSKDRGKEYYGYASSYLSDTELYKIAKDLYRKYSFKQFDNGTMKYLGAMDLGRDISDILSKKFGVEATCDFYWDRGDMAINCNIESQKDQSFAEFFNKLNDIKAYLNNSNEILELLKDELAKYIITN